METLVAIRQEALDNKVPIMSLESIQFVSDVIYKNQAVSILEIGTAVGFSACALVDIDKNRTIDTVERDVERFKEAEINIKAMGFENNINAHLCDAFDYKVERTYDALIIDAAKAQNLAFFRLFFAYTDKVCIIDNMNYHGFVDEEGFTKIRSRRMRQMIQKIQTFKQYLDDRDDLIVEHSDVGDGITIVRRRRQ